MTRYGTTERNRVRENRRRSLIEHERAVTSAEMKRLVTALRPFGVLHRDALSPTHGPVAGVLGHHRRADRLALGLGLELLVVGSP
jgi:hypothetical protein